MYQEKKIPVFILDATLIEHLKILNGTQKKKHRIVIVYERKQNNVRGSHAGLFFLDEHNGTVLWNLSALPKKIILFQRLPWVSPFPY